MKKILSLASIVIIIAMGCTKNDSQPVSVTKSSKGSPNKFGSYDPQPDGTYYWAGSTDDLSCSGDPMNCTIITVPGNTEVDYNKFVDSVAKGPTAIAAFFNNSTLTNTLFPFFTASGATTTTTQTLTNLQSGNYAITAVSDTTKQASYLVYQTGTTNSYTYQIVTNITW